MLSSRTRFRRTRNLLTALIGLMAVIVAGLVLAAPANAANGDIKINEVESNGDTRDWIELTNTGSTLVDLGGWILKDNDDSHSLPIAAGTTIAPGAYLAFDVDNPATPGNFGLGGADSARVYSPDGTLIDSYSWTAHAGVTYGRCPNGTGSFANTSASTKGAANPCSAPDSAVKINEVESNGDTRDWIELTNTGSGQVDLGGWILKDNDDTHSLPIPAGTKIAPGAYLAFDVDNPTTSGNFGLGGADSARIYNTAGTLIDSYSWTAHAAITYGRCPNGTGSFVNTTASTKGAANACVPTVPSVVINEVESNGDQVGDWVELKNTGTTAVNISGWNLRDNDPTHAFEVVPAGTVLSPGGYYSVYTEFTPAPGFGLGTADSANLYLPDGTTLVDSYSWTAHAATTYGRCPDGTGPFATTTTPTRNAANACSSVRINEIQPNGGAAGDWVELKNVGSGSVNLTGWKLQNAAGTSYTFPGLSFSTPYVTIDQSVFGFDLGSSDTLKLIDNTGAVIEQYSWTSFPTSSWGRCKDGVGPLVDTKAPTKGTTNSCPGLDALPWPGGQTVAFADNADTFVQDLSGLVFDPSDPDVLWAAQNKKGTLYKLVRDANDNWVPASGWPRDPKFANGQGSPDTEGITIGPDGFVYLTTERDNEASGVSRNTILRFDPNSPAGPTITPTTEWNLTPLLPAVGANLGLEGVTYVPDSYLTSHGFKDQSTGATYTPSSYPLHGSGLFFTAFENNGKIYGFALDSDGTPHLVATVDSGFSALADVDFDPEVGRIRAVTDDTVDGKTSLLKVGADGDFVVDVAYDRPAGMPNLNNEGLAVAPQSRCVGGKKEVLWSDDGDTDGHSIRRGTINCTPPAAQTVTFTTVAPADGRIGQTYVPAATGGGSGQPVVISVDPSSASVCSIVLGVVSLNGVGTCTLNADQDADQGFLAGHGSQSFAVAKADQAISFAQPGGTSFGGADVQLTVTASSGLDVTLVSETPSVCTVVGAVAHPIGAGTCTITASQAGNDTFNAATPVSRSLTVAKADQAITFAQPADTVYGGSDVALTASASSGLRVTLTSQTPGVCTVVGATAHPVSAGTCTITATQDGDENWAGAHPVSRSLTVAKAPITVTTRATSSVLSLLTLRVAYTTIVKSALTGLPVAGVPVTTKLNGGSAVTGCTAVTNASGVATCSTGPIVVAILAPYTASAAETPNHLGGSATGTTPLL